MKTTTTNTALHSNPGRAALLVALVTLGLAATAGAQERLPRAELVAELELADLDPQHQVTVRLQRFALSGNMLVEGARRADEAGPLTTLFAGSGYLHSHSSGFFFDATVGGALTLTGDEVDGTGPDPEDDETTIRDPKEDNLDKALGAAVLASVGFTHRVSADLGLAYELFGGYYYGFDDNGREVSNGTVGIALSLDI